ncbi:bifunctional adenosylcobinamide kinase/adenosylcobinamide-phosphate guanylyltransferase [Sphingobium chlorophenolicum]|uniref:Bifunctional adenosylcobalamin biosynthesis protein n=1 Tax=Sphingobium chlorophenolicum TaxID=46429 RepID=A0A081R8P5_SPHCR|nr:bifunctional adenosylcobinamide kinase/adenosylcobinamide-phosphate guanylyltransferase [Sphingobium chlorophenolicum]KEQ51568.1 Adenosylcobinamide-phosphate guanylyltransferase [Sphingobium chlorophenolicum]
MTSLLVLGGCRSGKSRYAQEWCEAVSGGRLAYIATAQAFDTEMEERIARHRNERGSRWLTIDAPMDLPTALSEAAGQADAILIDCLTLWLTNLMLAEADISAARAALAQAVAACPVPVALVANEVGLGIVPDNALARRFRDEAGWLNQQMAAQCEQVVFLAAGLPIKLKA